MGKGGVKFARIPKFPADSIQVRTAVVTKNLEKRLDLALTEVAKCRENLHMAKTDKYIKNVKIDLYIEKIKISTNFDVSAGCVSQPYMWDSAKDMANGCFFFLMFICVHSCSLRVWCIFVHCKFVYLTS